MPSPAEIERIAHSMNAHRPDWNVRSLITFLTRNHANRSYTDLAVAATVVATDPTTTTPQLLNNHGRWWVATAGLAGDRSDRAQLSHDTPRCDIAPHHHHEPAHNCAVCRSDALTGGTE